MYVHTIHRSNIDEKPKQLATMSSCYGIPLGGTFFITATQEIVSTNLNIFIVVYIKYDAHKLNGNVLVTMSSAHNSVTRMLNVSELYIKENSADRTAFTKLNQNLKFCFVKKVRHYFSSLLAVWYYKMRRTVVTSNKQMLIINCCVMT